MPRIAQPEAAGHRTVVGFQIVLRVMAPVLPAQIAGQRPAVAELLEDAGHHLLWRIDTRLGCERPRTVPPMTARVAAVRSKSKSYSTLLVHTMPIRSLPTARTSPQTGAALPVVVVLIELGAGHGATRSNFAMP